MASGTAAVISVVMNPGKTQLTRTRRGATSLARALVRDTAFVTAEEPNTIVISHRPTAATSCPDPVPALDHGPEHTKGVFSRSREFHVLLHLYTTYYPKISQDRMQRISIYIYRSPRPIIGTQQKRAGSHDLRRSCHPTWYNSSSLPSQMPMWRLKSNNQKQTISQSFLIEFRSQFSSTRRIRTNSLITRPFPSLASSKRAGDGNRRGVVGILQNDAEERHSQRSRSRHNIQEIWKSPTHWVGIRLERPSGDSLLSEH